MPKPFHRSIKNRFGRTGAVFFNFVLINLSQNIYENDFFIANTYLYYNV